MIPTDTVYGLAARGDSEQAVRRLYAFKRRAETRPTALVACSVVALEVLLPELVRDSRHILEALLPGPFTLVLADPARRLPWLNPERPDAIGVRVPAVDGMARAVLEAVGAVAATSANNPGGPDPVSLADVPAEILARAACAVDGGELPGVPSTVIDFTQGPPVVLRRGAGDATEALARLARTR